MQCGAQCTRGHGPAGDADRGLLARTCTRPEDPVEGPTSTYTQLADDR